MDQMQYTHCSTEGCGLPLNEPSVPICEQCWPTGSSRPNFLLDNGRGYYGLHSSIGLNLQEELEEFEEDYQSCSKKITLGGVTETCGGMVFNGICSTCNWLAGNKE